MEDIFTQIEKVYFRNWSGWEKILQDNEAYTYISFLNSILIILNSITDSNKCLISNRDIEIKIRDSQKDPILWRSIDNYKYEIINVNCIIQIIGNNQSQIDISRRIKKKLGDSNSIISQDQFTELKNKHLNMPEIEFINSLRNYFQHYSIPYIHWESSKTFEQNIIENYLAVDRTELLEHIDIFKSGAKQYILANNTIKIDQILLIYINSLFGFYQELFFFIFSNLGDDLDDYLQLLECKNQIVKRLRKEEFTRDLILIEKIAANEKEIFLNNVKKMNTELFKLMYQSNCFLRNLHV